MRRDVIQYVPVKLDGPFFRGNQSVDGMQCCGFSGAVGTDQRHDFPLVHLERNPLNGANHAIADFQIFYS